MKIFIMHSPNMDLNKIGCYTDVVSYYLLNAFRNVGIEICGCPIMTDYKNKDKVLEFFNNINPQGAQHFLALGLRYFTHFETSLMNEILVILRKKFKGIIAQWHDCALPHIPVVTFHNRKVDTYLKPNKNDKYYENSAYISWAADSELLQPKQINDTLHILIDHANYHPNKDLDFSDIIIKDVANFALNIFPNIAKITKYKKLKIRRLVSGGVEDFNPLNPWVDEFNRKGLPYLQMIEEYNKADIFISTHHESVGLALLEASMAGALVLAPKTFINYDIISSLHHVTFEGGVIPWNHVISEINPWKSREISSKFTWNNIVQKMMQVFVYGSMPLPANLIIS